MDKWQDLGKRISEIAPIKSTTSLVERKEEKAVVQKTRYDEIEELNKEEKKRKKKEVMNGWVTLRKKKRGMR